MSGILLSLAALSTGAWLAIIVAWPAAILVLVWAWCKVADLRRMRKYEAEFREYAAQLRWEEAMARQCKCTLPGPAPAPADPTDSDHAARLMAGGCYRTGEDAR